MSTPRWSGGGHKRHRYTAPRPDILHGRWKLIDAGLEDVTLLDDEEIITGRLRNKSGQLGGRPRIYPRAFIDEQARRLLQSGDQLFKRSYRVAIETVVEVAQDVNYSAADRLKAAMWIVERVGGKTPDRITLSAEDPIEAIFRSMLMDPDGLDPVPHEPSRSEL